MLAMLFVPIAALAGVSWWLVSKDAIRPRDVMVSVVLVAWIAVVGTKVYTDRAVSAVDGSADVTSDFRLPQWSAASTQAPAAAPVPDDNGALTAAPVADLIGRLEARLASDPNDAKGWALLAQSYAFVGDTVGAERALGRAVALGADEQALRERVQAARRGPDAHGWVEQTIGG
jgi:cytochrome c-type biogenesis protein CcmH/NrfG